VDKSEHDLKQYMRSLPAMAKKQHIVRSTQERASYDQTLQISWTTAEMLSPKAEKGKRSIQGSYVRVWCEIDPDIEWILFTFSKNHFGRTSSGNRCYICLILPIISTINSTLQFFELSFGEKLPSAK